MRILKKKTTTNLQTSDSSVKTDGLYFPSSSLYCFHCVFLWEVHRMSRHSCRPAPPSLSPPLQVSVAIGCAVRDRNVVFASTFATFFTRAFDQLRMAAISESNINLCGSHCGVSIGQDPSLLPPIIAQIIYYLTFDLSVAFRWERGRHTWCY